MTSPRWDHVLFDFDGTLANTIPLILGSYRHVIDTYGLPASDDATIRSWIGRTLPDVCTELVGVDRAPEVGSAYSAWQRDNIDAYLEPFAGIDGLLADLAAAGVRGGVVTSRRRPSVEDLARRLGLDEHVTVLAALEDTSRHKPDPAPLLLAADRLGIDPASCVYVGDAVVDLRAAAAAGMQGIGVVWGAGLPAELHAAPHTHIATSVEDLRSVLLPGD